MSESRQGTAGQPKSNAELRSYFATPILVIKLPRAASINAALRETVLERERSIASLEHSNLGGWQSTWDFHQWCGEPGTAVLNTARKKAADQLTADRHGQRVKIDWKMNSRANINRTGHGNEFHTHAGAFWSATYYVDDGGVGEDPSLGGEFEMQDPRGVAPAMYAPGLAFAVPGGQSVGASELISPAAGTMILFPSWLSHAVRPYKGTGTRISIALNLSL
jgi:uncharacterized protein (TIGR02466 family)